jgi:glycosyltransferase involved in cell wall biosynthesis
MTIGLTPLNKSPIIKVIIPAFNEAESISNVIADIPLEMVSEIIVIDNNSSDCTADVARTNGATVLKEKSQGYGFACMRGIEYLKSQIQKPEIVVFLDADYSDYPSEIPRLISPITENGFDMVIGSRLLGNREKGAMPWYQVHGNIFVTNLIKVLYGVKFTDLGPFRAIKWNSLLALNIMDRTYGWTIEMQLKAAKCKMNVCEVPVDYRARIGKSKISGTFKGACLATYIIITTIIKYI